MDFWDNLWGLLWFTFWLYLVLALLGALFWIMSDLFRDTSLSGWLKALWLVGLIFLPVLCLIAYLVARGDGMGVRREQRSNSHREAQDSSIRPVAVTSLSDEISKARALLDAGSITAEEFNRIKERAIS